MIVVDKFVIADYPKTAFMHCQLKAKAISGDILA